MKTTLFLFLLLSLLNSCSKEDGQNPTSPAGENVIVVNAQTQKVSERSACGSSGAPCSTLAEALAVAEGLQSGIPTIWLKGGNYQLDSAAPLEIRTPVNLIGEENQNVEIHSGASAFHIFASNVSFKGFRIISHDAGQVTSVMLKGGQAFFTDMTISNQGDSADPGGVALSIDNGGHAVLENTHLESLGAGAVDVFNGKLGLQGSTISADSDAVRIHAKGRGTFDRSTFKGKIFVSGGSLSIVQSETRDISIADGAYATLRNNTIRGWVSLMWKHAYAEIQENHIYGRLSAVDAKAAVTHNTIYGNQQGEGVTAFNFAMLTLTHNSISGTKNALYAHLSSTLTLNHNQFNSETEGAATIFCDTSSTIKSDGANTIKHSSLHLSCGDLPETPGTEPF